MNKETKDPMLVEQAQMEETHDYLIRGRALRGLDDDQLKERWTVAFKAWFYDRTKYRDLEDATAELQLRDAVPPYETVSGELAAMAPLI
jgi:hypothetical protein